MTAFEQGKEARKDGKSEAYNPYRNKGLASDYIEWVKGWKINSKYDPSSTVVFNWF